MVAMAPSEDNVRGAGYLKRTVGSSPPAETSFVKAVHNDGPAVFQAPAPGVA